MIMNESCIKIQVYSVVGEHSGLCVPDETRTEVFIRVNSPDGMYPRSVYENILYFELLTMLLEGWLDVTILHWFAMKHWSLIIVCPDFKFSYIVDSINDGKTLKNYKLVKIIEEVFEINFKWHMVQLWNEEGDFEESQIENLVVDLMFGFI
ncbi:hypothetical protein HanXRQr2_Chr13g0610901 [Helianthus annuus]|uniref:Ulp1 protease family, C-terminal catalytic domain-containing protein n=2 Tax=Helianthus annuus TaxID=4232 RepID=A0A9K3HDR6_HELAN|nr:hypothetical protein HanXRQr2_Chr13g0610901 [Helianthus annuus]